MRRRTAGGGDGFSLVEGMVALCIFGFLAAAVMSASLMLHKTFAGVADSGDFLRQVRYLDARMANDARTALSVATIYPEQLQFTQPDGAVTRYQLTPDADGADRLERISDTGTERLLHNVVSWNWTLPTPTTPLELAVVVERRNTRGGVFEQTFKRTFTLRGIAP